MYADNVSQRLFVKDKHFCISCICKLFYLFLPSFTTKSNLLLCLIIILANFKIDIQDFEVSHRFFNKIQCVLLPLLYWLRAVC